MPQLRISGPDGNEQWLDLEGDDFILGRDPNVPIPLQDRKVSRKHARIYRRGDEFFIEDLGSANGVLMNGRPIRKPICLVNGTEMEIGPFLLTFAADPDQGTALAFSLLGLNGPVEGQVYQLPQADIFIGRGDDSDIAIPDGSISRKHAVLEVGVDSLMVEDLGSSNGTFVNGTRVAREPLEDGDQLRFGSIDFEVQVEGVADADGGRRLPGSVALDKLRGADNSVKLAVAMGGMTVLLLIVVVAILVARGPGNTQSTGIDPFIAYEKAIDISLATARAQFQGESWDAAVRSYQDVLDQDPINAEARKGLYASQNNRDHRAVINAAQQAIRDGRPTAAIGQLGSIPRNSYYNGQASTIVNQARRMAADQAIADARQYCRGKDWRACHRAAVTALTHRSDDPIAIRLLADAERQLKKNKIPFTPWAP